MIEQHPEDTWAIGIRGTAYRQFGYLSQALEDYDQVLTLVPDNDWWYYNCALTHHLLGQLDSAQSDLAIAIQIASSPTFRTHIPSRLNLALYCLANREVKKAVTIYQELLPKASFLLRRGAIRELKELLAVIPSDTIASPNSLEAEILGEVLHSHGLEVRNKHS